MTITYTSVILAAILDISKCLMMPKWHHPGMKSVDNFGQKIRKRLHADFKTHLHL